MVGDGGVTRDEIESAMQPERNRRTSSRIFLAWRLVKHSGQTVPILMARYMHANNGSPSVAARCMHLSYYCTITHPRCTR